MMSTMEIAALDTDVLFKKIAEESSELIQATMKHSLHGATPYFAGVQYNNVRDVKVEWTQLQMLMTEYYIRFD